MIVNIALPDGVIDTRKVNNKGVSRRKRCLKWLPVIVLQIIAANAYASELVVATTKNIGTLDPAKAYEMQNVYIAAAVGAGLLRWDEKAGKPRLDLARELSVEDGGKSLIFTLHEDVRFQNGRLITAEDFVFSFHRILSPSTKSPIAGFFRNISGAPDYMAGKRDDLPGVVARNSNTFVIKLEKPDASIMTVLSLPFGFVVPRESVNQPEFHLKPVGAGPYKLVSLNADELVLAKSELYKRGNDKSVDRIVFKLEKQAGTKILLDVEAGKVHYSEQHTINSGFARFLADDAYAQFVRYFPDLSTELLDINMHNGPLVDSRLRRALNFGINKPELVTNLGSVEAKSSRHMLPESMIYNPDRENAFPYDPEEARRLVAQTQYRDELELKLVTIDSVLNRSTVKKLSKDLQGIGIFINSVFMPEAEFWGLGWERSDFDLLHLTFQADYPEPSSYYYPLFTGGSSAHEILLSRFHDESIDARAIQIDTQTGEELSEKRRLEWEVLIHDIHTQHTPWVPLFHRKSTVLVSDTLRGLEPFLHGGNRFYVFESLWLSDSK